MKFKCGVGDCVLRPAHRKPLHPAHSPCQSRCLSIQVPAAAARWGGHRCPARAPRASRSPARLASPRPADPGPPASAAPSSCLDLAGFREPQGARTPSSARRPAQPRPAPTRPASLLQPRLPGNYHGAPTSGRSRRPRPPAGLRPREAGNSARPRPRPGLPRPGRAPGGAPHARLPASRSPVRAGSSPPYSRRGEPRPAPSRRRGASPNTPPSRLTRPGRAATPARACRPPSAAPPRDPLCPPPPPRSRPRLQILPRRLCSTRTSRLSSSPVSGSAVPVTAGASGEAAAAAGAAAAMVPPGPYRSPTACVAGQGGARRGLGRIEPRSGPAPASGCLAPPLAPCPPASPSLAGTLLFPAFGLEWVGRGKDSETSTGRTTLALL